MSNVMKKRRSFVAIGMSVTICSVVAHLRAYAQTVSFDTQGKSASTPKTPDAYLFPTDPHKAPNQIKRASDLLSKGEIDSAISELQKLLETDKDNIDARRYLALALLSKKLPLQALDQLNLVIIAGKPLSYDYQLIGQVY